MLHRLNFKHLRYFMLVAQEGSIVAAAEKLALTSQTISGQIKQLEQELDVQLFAKQGRRLVLTDAGQQALEYAEQIFSLGESMQEKITNPSGAPQLFSVGITDALPKLAAYRLLEPALNLKRPFRLECREGSMESLLADLATHRVDMVLTDRPVDSTFNVLAYNHLLGDSRISFFASNALAKDYAPNFPDSLNGAPMLMPTGDSMSGADFRRWCQREKIQPKVVVECDDHALLGTFGQAGKGIFCGPSFLEPEIETQYAVQSIGQLKQVRERFYAVSLERRIRHPGVNAVIKAAKKNFIDSQPQEKESGSDSS